MLAMQEVWVKVVARAKAKSANAEEPAARELSAFERLCAPNGDEGPWGDFGSDTGGLCRA